MEATAMSGRIRGKQGVTLVEVLISLTILLIVFLGLIQAALVSIQSNMKNVLRDEAVQITSDEISRLRGTNFDDMDRNSVADVYPLTFNQNQSRTYRASITVPFAVTVNIVALDANNKRVTVTTTWTWQNENFQHQIMTTRSR